jgi:tetratricopeptide (TPR) repeat protein
LDINTVLGRDPNNVAALTGRGISLLLSNQFDRALISFNQVVEKSPNNVNGRLFRARTFLAQKDMKRAMADVDYVSGIQPDDPELLTVRGLIWSATQNYANAIFDLNKAVAKRETVENYIARGKAYEAGSEPAKAASDYRHAIAMETQSVFDVQAHAAAEKSLEQLIKRVPCSKAPGDGAGKACL